MNSEEFKRIFEDRGAKCRETLIEKAKEYATVEDRLHNFKKAAAFMDCTPEQALFGFLTKHLVSLSDMVMGGDEYTSAQWDEKLGDAMNYLFLLDAIIQESTARKRVCSDEIPTYGSIPQGGEY